MKILGIMGSPRLKGKCNRLTKKALEGAASAGAEIKNLELIKHKIKFCMGCGKCYLKDPELTMGYCPLKDDVTAMLEEYLQADGITCVEWADRFSEMMPTEYLRINIEVVTDQQRRFEIQATAAPYDQAISRMADLLGDG